MLLSLTWLTKDQDLIKVRGWQVAPAEIEAVLLTHPQIIGAAVLGVQDTHGTGELPRAFVVRKPKVYNEAATSYGIGEEGDQNDATEDEIKTFVAERLARYKYLDGGVQFVKEIPRNASGKVLKAKLRAMESTVATIETVTNFMDSTINGTFNEAASNGPTTIVYGSLDRYLENPVTDFGKDTITGTVRGTVNGTINVTVSEVAGEDSHTTNSCTDRDVLEKLQAIDNTIPHGRSNSLAEKVIGEAIEKMKQNMQNNNQIPAVSQSIGGKRKHSGMLTRRRKRQSMDMTAR